MAYNWFGEKERTLATSIAAFCNIFGTAVAFAMGFIVTEDGSTLYISMAVQSGFCVILAVATILLFSSKPPTPPSRSSQKGTTLSNKESAKAMLTNIYFFLLMITYSVGFGVLSAIIACLGQILTPQGYTQTDSSIYGLTIITVGLIGCVVFGTIADRTKKFKICLWVCAIGALLGTSVFCLGMFFQKTVYWFWIILAAFVILGIFSVPFVPLSLEIACEITYPVAASIPNTTLGLTGTLAGIVFTFLFPLLQEPPKPDNSPGSMRIPLIVGLVSFVIALSFLICFRGTMKRTAAEQAEAEKEEAAKLFGDSDDNEEKEAAEEGDIPDDKAALLINPTQPVDLLAASYGAIDK
eukprot:CAMPEP_0117418872 /NCGR_PEP_ID=MMETSP0758-20121206/563_1 /TAXON_ID=63605 /ORGANISM="Percolomonas cosmopolitus, Strain AE-1 (ATCC 50343)" /LENGTH=352 /DNA_ID=CAMNT_0005199629 /DNA_START=459 /DNA_END=1517 /DNA_ORIENTATION=+